MWVVVLLLLLLLWGAVAVGGEEEDQPGTPPLGKHLPSTSSLSTASSFPSLPGTLSASRGRSRRPGVVGGDGSDGRRTW